MSKNSLLHELKSSHEYFNRSTRPLTEDNSGYTPASGMMTAAQVVAHVAHTVDWFLQGAFSPKGFDTDFENQAKKYMACKSLKEARTWLDKSFAAVSEAVQSKSEADLNDAVAPGPLMAGVSRINALAGIIEHTAHHRGALTVYSRLLGKVPPMPYMDM